MCCFFASCQVCGLVRLRVGSERIWCRRAENGLTYGIYSAGISDEQKRGIVDQIRLPM